MCLFEVVEAGEGLVEVLSKEENLLRDVDDLLLLGVGDPDETLDDLVCDEVLAFELLANLEGNIKGTDSDKRGLLAAELVVVHRHLGQVHGHLVDQVVQAFGSAACRRDVLLFFGGEASLAHVADSKDFVEVFSEEVEHSRCRDLVLNCFQDVKLERLDVFDRKFGVGNFLVNHLHFQGVNVFVLGRDEHRCDTDDVEDSDLQGLRLRLEVPVEE